MQRIYLMHLERLFRQVIWPWFQPILDVAGGLDA
jgi:hypothetical protein